jgi:sugar lactone lactonase YvrE
MRLKLLVLVAFAMALAVAAVSGAAAGPRGGGGGHGHGHGDALPDRIDLPDGWQPEGIAAGRGSALYVGSIPTGAVLRADARTGQVRTVVPGKAGRAAIGLKADRRERLFVAGGPTGKAFVYDARTGRDLAEFQLAAAGDIDTFVNDVALTRRTAYFTDSRKSQIYAVDIRLDSSRTIPLPDIPDEEGNNLNGIVATGQAGILLAVQTNGGRLWRIDAATGKAVQVDLGGEALANGDGLLLRGRTLYVVQNRSNRIAVVRLAPDLASGRIVTRIETTGFDVPTTIAFQRGELYAVNARFGTTDPQPAKYWITLVRR